MIHLPELIQDLTLILVAAGIVTVLFRKIKQPVVLGYILAGFLVSPHIPIFPTVVDEAGIKVWAEIGVIFLLFALGLEFSFKKLFRVGGSAVITAVVEVAAMTLIGYGTGWMLGWSGMDSLFLGGILAISSTTIIIRAFEETGVKGRGFVGLVFGVLIVEDLVAILLLVLLSTVAVSRQFEGLQMITAMGKLGFFLTLWFLSGIFFIPTLLNSLKKIMSEETLLIISLALCFLMVSLATQAGFSPALGAFIMGSILAETTAAQKIEHLITPVKDLFAAIFFVSVGMLIDPQVLIEYAGPVLLITLITIFGKLLSTTVGSLISGQSLKHSVQAGMSLAQIGEFSFIIAALGQTLEVTSQFLYPIAVGVSAATTLCTPYLIRASDPAYRFLESRLPKRWLSALEGFRSETRSPTSSSQWSSVAQSYFARILINGVITAAIFLVLARILPPWIRPRFGDRHIADVIMLVIALACSSPFIRAFAFSRPRGQAMAELWSNPRNRGPIIALEALRIALAIALFSILSTQFISLTGTLIVALVLIGALFVLFSKRLDSTYHWFEMRFMRNLSEKEELERAASPSLAPWDAHITKFEVHPDSMAVGNTLAEMGIRERFGVTLAMIERGSRRITAPGRNERIYPHDRVSVIGTDEQIQRFRRELEGRGLEPTAQDEAYTLHQILVTPESAFHDKSIRESGIRERSRGLIVGIERQGQRFLNPDSTAKIRAGDQLWLVAGEDEIRALKAAGDIV